MKHYRRFRVIDSVIHTILEIIAVGTFVYFVFQYALTVPILN